MLVCPCATKKRAPREMGGCVRVSSEVSHPSHSARMLCLSAVAFPLIDFHLFPTSCGFYKAQKSSREGRMVSRRVSFKMKLQEVLVEVRFMTKYHLGTKETLMPLNEKLFDFLNQIH